jgi:hypothetical protein
LELKAVDSDLAAFTILSVEVEVDGVGSCLKTVGNSEGAAVD